MFAIECNNLTPVESNCGRYFEMSHWISELVEDSEVFLVLLIWVMDCQYDPSALKFIFIEEKYAAFFKSNQFLFYSSKK